MRIAVIIKEITENDFNEIRTGVYQNCMDQMISYLGMIL